MGRRAHRPPIRKVVECHDGYLVRFFLFLSFPIDSAVKVVYACTFRAIEYEPGNSQHSSTKLVSR